MATLHSENLYDEILIAPLQNPEVNKLLIVSGYATAAMSFHHLNYLSEQSKNIKIQLIVGMTLKDGLALGNHKGFTKLVSQDFSTNFECRYIAKGSVMHSKAYTWCSDDKPVSAFVGSANYTQTAFLLKSQREIMTGCNPNESADYFRTLLDESILCDDPEVQCSIQIYKSDRQHRKYQQSGADSAEHKIGDYSDYPSVTVSLLGKSGDLPSRSGLNWGQRPEEGREPNQAYIRLTSDIYHSNFFPPVSIHFTFLTDDGETLVCTRAQQNGKAIHTPHNNSLIGEYFRRRLGVAQGEPVTKDHLIRYGRTDITFYKVDDETFYMDFSA